MSSSTTAIPVLRQVPRTGSCPVCGEDAPVDPELRIEQHSGYRGLPAVCAGASQRAGHFAGPAYPSRPVRAPRAVWHEPSIRFQVDEAWQTQLTCSTCSKVELLPYATLQRVQMPSHGKWVNGNREPCAGGVAMPGKQQIITRGAARSAAILGGGLVAVVLVVLALLLSNCSGDDGSDAVGRNAYSGSGVPAVEAPAAPVQDTSIADYVRAAGVGDELVRQLGQVAGDTGYGLSRGVALEFEDARSFAVVMIDNCRQLADGSLSAQDMVDRDVADGAPVADAQMMTAFLEGTFCPAVR